MFGEDEDDEEHEKRRPEPIYLFVFNEPVKSIDSLGLSCVSDCVGACLDDHIGRGWRASCLPIISLCLAGQAWACPAAAACVGWGAGYGFGACTAHCGGACAADPCYEYDPDEF